MYLPHQNQTIIIGIWLNAKTKNEVIGDQHQHTVKHAVVSVSVYKSMIIKPVILCSSGVVHLADS